MILLEMLDTLNGLKQVNIYVSGSRNVYEIDRGNEKENITTLLTFSAAGDDGPHCISIQTNSKWYP